MRELSNNSEIKEYLDNLDAVKGPGYGKMLFSITSLASMVQFLEKDVGIINQLLVGIEEATGGKFTKVDLLKDVLATHRFIVNAVAKEFGNEPPRT